MQRNACGYRLKEAKDEGEKWGWKGERERERELKADGQTRYRRGKTE